MKRIILILLLILASCNVTKDKFRQVAKVSRIESKDIVTEKVSEINTGKEWDYSDVGLRFRPIDETKAITIIYPSGEKTSVKNAEIEYSVTTEKKKDTTSLKETTRSEDKSRSSEDIKVKVEEKKKDTSPDWKFYLLGIPLIVALYFAVRWFRKKYPGII